MHQKIYAGVMATLLVTWVSTTNIAARAQTDIAPSVQETAEEYYRQASKEYLDKNYKAAISHFTKAIQIDPNYHQAYYERGLCYVFLGDPKKAIQDYSEAIRIEPSYAVAYWRRGEDRLDTKGRMNDFNMAIKLDPKFPHAYLSRGELFSKLGQREAAIKDLKTAVGIFKGLNDQKGYQISLDALKSASR